MKISFAYITARKHPRFEWMADGLSRQLASCPYESEMIVVDFFAQALPDRNWTAIDVEKRKSDFRKHSTFTNLIHVPNKPNVWNGPNRLTTCDWFAAASHRNTSICVATGSHIVYLDDLSVPCDGFLNAVHEAVEGGHIGCGAYRKVKSLEVVDGVAVRYDETASGMDDRLLRVTKDVSDCTGGWLYGCSLVAPVEDLLEVGGWPEYMDGLGAEDYTLGLALCNAGKRLKYDRRMLTLESEELHFTEPPMRRTDKGVSPNDKSNAALHIAQASKYFPNYYEGGMRALREHVLNGGEFPIAQVPDRDWFDGQLISEMV